MYLLFGKWHLWYLAALGLAAVGGLIVFVRIIVAGSRTEMIVPPDRDQNEAGNPETDR